MKQLETKQTQSLHEIQNLLSQPYQLPIVPDVNRIKISRDKVYTIQRSAVVGPFSGNNATESSYALQFSLSQVPNSSEFTALFDQYRIVQVHLRFTPRAQGSTSIFGFFRPNYFLTVIDYDDINTVSSNAALQYPTLQISPTDEPFERTFNPRIAVAAYNGVATTGYANLSNQWIDVAYPDVQHFGLKGVIPLTTANALATDVLDCVATYTINFRNPR